MLTIINYLNETIKKHKNLLIFLIVIFILGLVFGSLFINFITDSDKVILKEQVTTYFSSVKKLSNDVFGINVFLSESLNNVIQLLIIFILGVSMVGSFTVVIILFFKGFMLGTTLSVIILNYQLKGVVGALLYVFPVMVINVLIYVFLSFFALHASIKFLKALLKKDNLNFKTFLGKYLLSFIISLILIIITSLIDAYLTPLLLKLFTFII